MSEKNVQEGDTVTAGGEESQKELTWEEACNHAKTNYFICKNTIDHKEEPIEAMKELSEFIEKVVEDYTCIEGNKDFKAFFYQDLALGLLKRLNKERSADPAYLEVIAEIMKQFTRLFANNITEVDLAESMKYVFDCNCTLHTYHYEDAESELRIIEQKKKEQWRHDLKIGDMIDAIKGDEKHKCWGVARVVEIKDEIVELEFENDSKVYDRAVNKFSSDVAPLGEFSKEQEWKKELKEGDEVDAFDKAKVWYASTILEVKDHTDPEGRKWTMCKVGFRLYHPDATKTDEEGKKYEGWSSRFDEWLPMWSPKVAKLYTHAKPKGGKGTRLYEDTVIDDSSDPQIKEGEEMVYAVIRPRK